MTFRILNMMIKGRHIPEDVKLMSDSGWECGATNCGAAYYNKDTNTIVFTQRANERDGYWGKDEWELICSEEW